MLTAVAVHMAFLGVAWLLTVAMLAVIHALLNGDANRERNLRCSMSGQPTTRITTQQAADMLGISRPTLIRLLESGRIPFERPGAHRRLRIDDVTAFRASISRSALAVPPPFDIDDVRQREYAAGRPN